MKADIQINGVNYSIKSSEKRPAIINHTFRRGFIRITNNLALPIDPLDDEVATYWKVRQGVEFELGEDVSGYDRRKASVFISEEFKEYFRPVFNYFALTGTGRSDSPAPAECILEFDDPTEGQRLTVATIKPEDKPWAQLSRGKIQAQLHVRAG